ncbi:MAG TPA: hypothetical protein P5096_02005 [Patescibacteria group bacterium]|nr:hypothetical protein [Patescibacteria group bacterium]
MSNFDYYLETMGSPGIKRDILELRDFFAQAEEDEEHKKELSLVEKIKGDFPQNTDPKEINKEAATLRIKQEKKFLSNIEHRAIFISEKTREQFKLRAREIVEAAHEKGIEELVFLDKSARLIGYFISKSWEAIYLGEPKPRISFVNIGTEKTGDLSKERVKNLQKNLVSTFGEKFKHKKICIIDEVMVSGITLVFASLLFEKTYPSSTVYSEWFSASRHYYNTAKDDVNQLIKKEPPNINGVESFLTIEKAVLEPEDEEQIVADPWQKKPFNNFGEERNPQNIFWRQQLKKLAYELIE